MACDLAASIDMTKDKAYGNQIIKLILSLDFQVKESVTLPKVCSDTMSVDDIV